MSAPWFAPGGSPPELRAEIARLMAAISIRAEIVARSVEIDDDVGAAYALRCLAAEVRAALSAGGMLAEVTKAEREQRRAARTQVHDLHEVRP